MTIQRMFTAAALCFAVTFTVAFAGGDCCAKKAKASNTSAQETKVVTVANTTEEAGETAAASDCAGKEAKACTAKQAKECSTKDAKMAKACATKAGKSDGCCASKKASAATATATSVTDAQAVQVVNDAGTEK